MIRIEIDRAQLSRKICIFPKMSKVGKMGQKKNFLDFWESFVITFCCK